jgi:hypothetical protein
MLLDSRYDLFTTPIQDEHCNMTRDPNNRVAAHEAADERCMPA